MTKVNINSKPSNKYSRIPTHSFLSRNIMRQLMATIIRYDIYSNTIIRQSKHTNNGFRLIIQYKAISFTKQFCFITHCIMEKEIIQILISTSKRMAS